MNFEPSLKNSLKNNTWTLIGSIKLQLNCASKQNESNKFYFEIYKLKQTHYLKSQLNQLFHLFLFL